MASIIVSMSRYRLVFALSRGAMFEVFLATHGFGRGVREAHRREFDGNSIEAATEYARTLSRRFGCDIVGHGADAGDSGDREHA